MNQILDNIEMLFGNDWRFVFHQLSTFLMCGKLKSAYLIAVKGDRVDAIREIVELAEKTGQSKMVEICKKYLAQYEGKRRLLRGERHSKENIALTTTDDEQQNVYKREIFA